jgi:thiosulfate reductase cytochrome b subunit
VSAQGDTVILYSRWIRYTHWVWALAVIILIGSGWRIYNQDLITGFGSPMFKILNFPVWITIGGDYEGAERVHNDFGLAGALLWHFAAMWLLFGSVAAYAIYGIASGHFRRKFVTIRPRQVFVDVADFIRGRLKHELGMRNAVQKLLYAIAVLLMILMVWSGLVLWKPVQFEEIGIPLGNYEGARYVHFFGMTGLVLFMLVHVGLTILVPKVLPPMITGRAPRSAVAGTVEEKHR